MTQIDDLRPSQARRIIDLVTEAGHDVSGWSHYGGAPSQNPKYCYEWCFRQGNNIILNIWFDNLEEEDGLIVQHLNMREVAASQRPPRSTRAKRFDDVVREAYQDDLKLRAVIQYRRDNGRSSAEAKMLDNAEWKVIAYDKASGAFTLARTSATSGNGEGDAGDEAQLEGKIAFLMRAHRQRERSLRPAKIAAFKLGNNGRVFCEVPGCKFDFSQVYGAIGQDYAEVHHLTPLALASDEGVHTRLEDLAVVCANCHAMVHRGGECRPLGDLVRESRK